MFGRGNPNVVEAEIRRLAIAEHLPYPQYAGHFDGPEWLLGQATSPLRGKGGTQAEQGDIILMRQDVGGDVTFYSLRRGGLCLASHGVVPLCGWDEAFRYWRRLADRGQGVEHV
jgi:hypothetical protein